VSGAGCNERSLLRTLEIVDVDEFTPLTKVADFATLLSSYTKVRPRITS
jgi:hypothetical protein